VEAEKQPLTRISATCPLPVDWPEQTVKLLSENKPPGCKTRERTIPGMGAVWVVECPKLSRGQSLEVERVYEITRSQVIKELKQEQLSRPRMLSRELRGYLRGSPGIETADRELGELAEKLGSTQKPPWEYAQAASQWIRENVRYELGEFRGAKFACQKRQGDCEDLSALMIALCRIAEIPARTVWVEGHAYPEFYLEDGAQQGHWIPVQLHGTEKFGTITETRPILQKGDQYRDPVTRQQVRYLPQQAIAFGGPATLSVTRSILAVEPGD
jgi:hypothetical protein